jgi:pentose-5-phosphate-3-epimerase
MVKKNGTLEVETSIKEGKDVLLHSIKETQTEPKIINSPITEIHAEVEKVLPLQQYTMIHARAGIKLPCETNLEAIKATYEVAWNIVQSQSDAAIEEGKRRMSEYLTKMKGVQQMVSQLQEATKKVDKNPEKKDDKDDEILKEWNL